MNQNDIGSSQEICRVCLEQASKMYPLVGPILNVDVNIATMITSCTSVEVVLNDDLPKRVCIPCFRTIRIAYNFVLQFKETNRKLLEQSEINKIKQDSSQQNYVIETLNDTGATTLQEGIFCEETEEEEIIITCVDEMLNNENNMEICDSLELRESLPKECKGTDISDTDQLKSELKPVEITVPAHNIYYRPLKKKVLKSYICPICSKEFRLFDSGFVRHLCTHHKDVILKCNKCSLETLFNVEMFAQHYKKLHQYQCHICNRSFRKKSSQYYHMKVHSEKKSYECSFENCTKSFLTPWNLRKHLNIHSDAIRYICSKCGRKFNTYDTFRYHQKTHDGNRNHHCPECGRSFLQSVHLKYHMWKHTGIKQFHCEKCDKSYTTITQLKKHKRKYCEAVS